MESQNTHWALDELLSWPCRSKANSSESVRGSALLQKCSKETDAMAQIQLTETETPSVEGWLKMVTVYHLAQGLGNCCE